MNPITVTYQEAGLLVPDSLDRQVIHRTIYSVLRQERGQWQERDFIYSVIQNRALKDQVFVTVRGQQLPDTVPVKVHTRTFEQGHRIHCRSNLITMAQNRENSNQYRHRRPDELQGWLEQLVARHGFSLCQSTWGRPQAHGFERRSSRFKIPSMDFTMALEVTDPERAAAAWLNAIGRKKGYGFGMLEDAPDGKA